MNELTAAFGEVWTPATSITALMAGLAMGFFVVGTIAANPLYASNLAAASAVGRLVGGMAIITGVVFYVGQAIAAIADGDAGWPRVVSRFGLWMVYAIALGIGSWLRLRRHAAMRAKAAVAQAHLEIGE